MAKKGDLDGRTEEVIQMAVFIWFVLTIAVFHMDIITGIILAAFLT